MTTRDLAALVVDAALEKKAEDIVVLDVSQLTQVADRFVIASGRSDTQVRAIADGIVERARAAGHRAVGIEGYSAGQWVLVDLSDVVVHVFLPEERDVYRLERLWGDAPVVVRIP